MIELRGERTQTVPLPRVAGALLRGLARALGPQNAVVAGGWVRDHLLEQPPNDVDLWIPRLPWDGLDDLLAEFKRDYPEATVLSVFRAAHVKDGEMARTNWVRRIQVPEEPTIELISTWEEPGLTFLERVACKFHVGLCRCGARLETPTALEPVAYVSDDFMRDVRENTLTFFGDYEGKHHEKMLARYPDREFLYPEGDLQEQDLGWVGTQLHGSSGGY